MIWPKNQPTPNVFELLQPGQILTVQVMKDMLGTKGARLTTDLSIPSRYLVMMPLVIILAYRNGLNLKKKEIVCVQLLNIFRQNINYQDR